MKVRIWNLPVIFTLRVTSSLRNRTVQLKYGTGKSGGNDYFDISYLKLENTEMKIVLLNQEDAPPGNLIRTLSLFHSTRLYSESPPVSRELVEIDLAETNKKKYLGTFASGFVNSLTGKISTYRTVVERNILVTKQNTLPTPNQSLLFSTVGGDRPAVLEGGGNFFFNRSKYSCAKMINQEKMRIDGDVYMYGEGTVAPKTGIKAYHPVEILLIKQDYLITHFHEKVNKYGNVTDKEDNSSTKVNSLYALLNFLCDDDTERVYNRKVMYYHMVREYKNDQEFNLSMRYVFGPSWRRMTYDEFRDKFTHLSNDYYGPIRRIKGVSASLRPTQVTRIDASGKITIEGNGLTLGSEKRIREKMEYISFGEERIETLSGIPTRIDPFQLEMAFDDYINKFLDDLDENKRFEKNNNGQYTDKIKPKKPKKPKNTEKSTRLGDERVERFLIEKQLARAGKSNYFRGYISALIKSGKLLAAQIGLKFGAPLTKEQENNLSDDVVIYTYVLVRGTLRL
ncbi:MAG: hypothetical protein KZQ62_13420, partial [Candidatus Thiodiazotropha sp. (ex Lucinoma aequizonata)]|nr:hypothetical protein [Candidatus Thiodiazotropha sp. (ex Lucinoma aequizonata)]